MVAAILTLLPLFGAGFFPAAALQLRTKLPKSALLLGPAALCLPYLLVALSFGSFSWVWLALYALLPIAIACLLDQARTADPDQKGNWRDFLLLLALGLAVDLRWFETAWPAGLSAFGKILLLDAGLFGFVAVRQLDGVGFDLRLTWRDLGFGLREFLLFAPIAIALGLTLGFLKFHPTWPSLPQFLGAYLFTFLFIAIPEEIFFRGWMQNLLERRLGPRFGRNGALIATALLFGVAHWNKRALHFNWRYVLLAMIAGIFYGRAWRQERRVWASVVTHATVDTVWSFWLR